MKSIAVLFLALVAASTLPAQAPNSLKGGVFIMSISSGSGTLAQWGSYFIDVSETGNSFNTVGIENVQGGSATYTYTKTSSSTGSLVATDTDSSAQFSVSVSFTSATSGVFSIAGIVGTQAGTFTAYIPETQPFVVDGWTYNGAFPWVYSHELGWLYYYPTDGGIWIQRKTTGQWIFKR